MMQFALLKDDGKSKIIESVPVNALHLSPYNPRRSRSEFDVKKLAERIDRNGYEITRAVWVYKNEDGYAVFAGGTRLLAAQMAGVESIPVVIHEGFTPDEITRLADEDNENDEYHSPVSIVDVWQDYKRLSELPADEYGKWTQERIAKAKGVGQSVVTLRLKLASLPESIIEIITKNNFQEGQIREILKLSQCDNFTPWLDRETAMLYIMESVLSKTKTPTAKTFESFVTELNEAIAHAEAVANDLGVKTFYTFQDGDALPYEWDARAAFLKSLYGSTARKLADVKRAEYAIRTRISKEADTYKKYVDSQAEEAERKRVESTPLVVESGQWWKLGEHMLYCGDTSKPEFYDSVPMAAFSFADPPYNADAAEWDSGFVWQNDWLIDKSPVVAVTPGISAIFDFARKTTMPYKWSIASWIKNGMTRGAMGFGNWVYISVFSGQSIHQNAQDVIQVTIDTGQTGETSHKGRKPEQLIIRLVELFTKRGDTVIDPFLGSGTTLFVCEQAGRKCVGGDIDPEYCADIILRWQNMTGKKAEKVGE